MEDAGLKDERTAAGSRSDLSPSTFIAGPTASGKSAVALALAERLHGEIISVDSMQVYKGLDIGTAKPAPQERARVPHHLLDLVEVSEPFDAAHFVALARQATTEIQARGRVPIFCGGTGLYFKAYLEGIGTGPPADPELRAKLEATPLPELLHELQTRDPVTCEKIDRQNPRRVIRAVEVIRLTHRPFSQLKSAWNQERTPPRFFALSRAPVDLRRRIDARVDEMFRQGLVEETRQAMDRGLERNRTAMQAIGYRQVVEHLRGQRSLDETVELIKIRTRQYAKRQMTWFRRQLRPEWILLEAKDVIETAVDRIASR